jgi:NADH:ubiquinone reductase (H+-translocating)
VLDSELSRAAPRVVIVGCGFRGLFCAEALKRAPRETVVVDRNNYHLFRPLLYHVASAALSPAHIAQPIRAILRDQENSLAELGVDARLGAPVTAIDEDRVEVAGERLRSYNVVWAAGVRAAPLVQSLGAELGPGGRVIVESDCSIPEHPNVFVVGDAAYLVGSHTGRQVPGVSQGAMQMWGRHVAKVIHDDLEGKRWLRDVGFLYTDDLAATLVRTVMTGILAQRPTIGRAQHMKTARKPCRERKDDRDHSQWNPSPG